jgi:hypothetical protein
MKKKWPAITHIVVWFLSVPLFFYWKELLAEKNRYRVYDVARDDLSILLFFGLLIGWAAAIYFFHFRSNMKKFGVQRIIFYSLVMGVLLFLNLIGSAIIIIARFGM